MSQYGVPDFIAFTLGIVVYFLGAFLTRRVAFLQNYNIPEPVSGGLAAAVITLILYAMFDIEVQFELATRDLLLVIFFTTIGLNARLVDLIAGGRMLVLLLIMTVSFMLLQNLIGLLGTSLFDLPSAVSVLLGSASLIGGHGTAIAWGPTIQEATGFQAASEIGIASATLGLVCAALLGGPIAKFLIDGYSLKPEREHARPVVGLPYEGDKTHENDVDHINLMRTILVTNIAIIIGYGANELILEMGLKLPLFVACLLAGIILSNTIPYLMPKLLWPARTRAMAVVSDYCLSIFLAMSLMSMKLWTLAELGAPLLSVLALQVVGTTVFILLILFRFLGRDYTAAVLSAGFAGFTLGATPTAIANMSSVTKRYGPAPLAFIVLPLVSAFFVDLANAFIIQFFVGL